MLLAGISMVWGEGYNDILLRWEGIVAGGGGAERAVAVESRLVCVL